MRSPLRTISFIASILLPSTAWAEQTPLPAPAGTGTVRGVVLDRAGGAPIQNVSVQLQESKLKVTTDEKGQFELKDVPAGNHVLYAAIVGFILVKRPVAVVAGQQADITIVMSEGTGTYSESVSVTAQTFPEQEKSVPAQQVLGSGDIQNLRSLVTNDPLRAVQVLPGVSTGDDFRSEFVVRGNPFSHLLFTLDGIPNAFLLHTVQQVIDGGSVAMLNGDILDTISLMNGSYPQRFGNRIGAEIDFHMREGSRDRRQARAGISGTDASIVAEGPIGRSKSASWLVSFRKSYLEYLLKKVAPDDDFGFGFSDIQSKVVWDASSRHSLEFLLVAGRSRLDQTIEDNDTNDIADGRNAAELVQMAWRFTPKPSLVLTQRAAVGFNQYRNDNINGVTLGDGSGRDATWRADVVAQHGDKVTTESGAQVQWLRREDRLAFSQGVLTTNFGGRSTHGSAYAQLVWTPSTRLTIVPGARVDHWSLTSETDASPWLQASWQMTPSLTVRGGGGIYRQFPGIDIVTGPFGSEGLQSERAYHTDVGLEYAKGRSRWQVTVFNREERDALRLDQDLRLVNNIITFPSAPRWANTLDGFARGVELLFQRRSASGISGWFAYWYSLNRYRDNSTGEVYNGDFDQRHGVNAYFVARLTNRSSLAFKFRAGTNFPIQGYWRQQGEQYFLGTEHNTVRIPTYSRLDVRFNRAFNLSGKRLTLFVEVLNLLGRENMRSDHGVGFVRFSTREAFGLLQTMIPRVPSAGMLIEF